MHKQYIKVMENYKQKTQGTAPCVFCENLYMKKRLKTNYIILSTFL